MKSLLVGFVVTALAASNCVVPPIDACATAFPSGAPVHLADQAVIIVWDAANKVEHFIRKASFDGATRDFGFIVPTPSKPAIGEAKDTAFTALESLTAPKTEWTLSIQPMTCPIGCGDGSRHDRENGSSVRVLDRLQVAGYDAAVLEADNAKALGEWLARHGYHFRPELTNWFEHYLAKKWIMTAFKIASGHGPKATATTTAVRMSFETDQPFFPYRVPDERSPQRRLLRIFFLGDARVAATTGASPWSAPTVWADRLSAKQLAAVTAGFGLDKLEMPAETWLTTFDDSQFPNPRIDDVYFHRMSNPAAVHREPIVRYFWVPADVAAMVVGFGLYYWIARRRRSQSVLPHVSKP